MSDERFEADVEPDASLLDTLQENVLAKADRLTVRASVYHEHCCDGPVQAELSYSEMLETIEQPWVRRIQVFPRWTPLETGWIKQCSLMAIENKAKLGEFRNPSDEEKEAFKKKVILVAYQGCDTPWAIIRPGRFIILEPASLDIQLFSGAEGENSNIPGTLYLWPR